MNQKVWVREEMLAPSEFQSLSSGTAFFVIEGDKAETGFRQGFAKCVGCATKSPWFILGNETVIDRLQRTMVVAMHQVRGPVYGL